MKLIAFLLPQFHQIPENDQWWGEGFTEWTNTRKANSIYPGHLQPREPYEDYYYDLTDPATRRWQAELAQYYGIYGFCYYHYWFKGKQLLETPFKQVLSSGEPRIPFCLSWANEPWTRKWDGGEHDVLMPQEYGEQDDWELHFYALLDAFRDERYIRIENKPIFIIYRPDKISCCEHMMKHWNNLAVKNGLEGIYFVRTLGGFPLAKQDYFDANLEFEPHYTFAHSGLNRLWSYMNIGNEKHYVFDYDFVWQYILNRSHHRDRRKIFPGAYVNWDNTPRLGLRGLSCLGANPQKFGWYLTRQIERAVSLYNSEFLFINAWNEWAEGTYLEPDKHYQYQYLEAVRTALKTTGFYTEPNTMTDYKKTGDEVSRSKSRFN